MILRGLDRRGVRIERNWALGDTIIHNDKPRKERMLERLTEREMLITGYPSSYGSPKHRVALDVETRPI